MPSLYELQQRLGWDDMYLFLSNGHPPLILQLLTINTIFLILFILKRIWGRKGKEYTTYAVQILLISANILVVYEQQWMPWLDNYIYAFQLGLRKV